MKNKIYHSFKHFHPKAHNPNESSINFVNSGKIFE